MKPEPETCLSAFDLRGRWFILHKLLTRFSTQLHSVKQTNKQTEERWERRNVMFIAAAAKRSFLWIAASDCMLHGMRICTDGEPSVAVQAASTSPT